MSRNTLLDEGFELSKSHRTKGANIQEVYFTLNGDIVKELSKAHKKMKLDDRYSDTNSSGTSHYGTITQAEPSANESKVKEEVPQEEKPDSHQGHVPFRLPE